MSSIDRMTRFSAAADKPTLSRLFLATFLTPSAQVDSTAVAKAAQREHGLHGPLILPDRRHVTLFFLGKFLHVPPSLVALARKAADRVRMQAFDVTFDRAMSFDDKPVNRPFVLLGGNAVDGLLRLHSAIGSALDQVGVGAGPSDMFLPHVTLFYDDQALPIREVEPVRWRVREFVLIQSLQRKTVHIPLSSWRLEG